MSSTSAVLSGSKYPSQGRGVEFAVTIVSADYYSAAPTCLDVRYSDFRGAEVKRVPVIRIFGSTAAGQKVCLHVHGVLPYIHIPYDGSLPPDKICMTVGRSLNKGLNASMGCPESANQHIHQVSLVSGIPFYGYHEESCTFLRIVYYNPSMLNRLSDLLMRGCVLGIVFQPHDAHVPYILQFFIDYNLYGMNQIRLSSVKFRRQPAAGASPVASNTSSTITGSLTTPKMNETRSDEVIDITRLPPDKMMPKDCERTSTCALEADASAWHILNHLEHRSSAAQDGAGNPGIEFIWADERARRAAAGNSNALTPPSSPPRSQVLSAESHKFYYDRLMAKLKDAAEDTTSPKSDTSARGYPMNATTLLANQVEIKPASDVTRYAPSHSATPDESQASVSQSDMELADLLAHLDESMAANAPKPASEEVLPVEEVDGDVGGRSARGRLVREEGAIIELGTPKPTPEQEQEDEMEALEMSQAWDTASFDWGPSSPAADEPEEEDDDDDERDVDEDAPEEEEDELEIEEDEPEAEEDGAPVSPQDPPSQIPQVDGMNASEGEGTPSACHPRKKKRRYKRLGRRPRSKLLRSASLPSFRSQTDVCCVRVQRIANGSQASQICCAHGLNFDDDFPGDCSLLEEQEMSYFSRKLRSGLEPGKTAKIFGSTVCREPRRTSRVPAPSGHSGITKPCKVVLERLSLQELEDLVKPDDREATTEVRNCQHDLDGSSSSNESVFVLPKRVKFVSESPEPPVCADEEVNVSPLSSESDEEIAVFSEEERPESADRTMGWNLRDKFERDRRTFNPVRRRHNHLDVAPTQPKTRPSEPQGSEGEKKSPKTQLKDCFHRKSKNFFSVDPPEVRTVTIPSPETPISTFVSDEEVEVEVEPSQTAEKTNVPTAGGHLIGGSRTQPSTTKRWPLADANKSRFVSFYDFGSPTLVARPKLGDSSSAAEASKEEDQGNEAPTSEKTPPILLEESSPEVDVVPARVSLEDATLVPFLKPPKRRVFARYVKNPGPFWGNVEDHLEATEGNKARTGTGDLLPVACYTVSAVEPFSGDLGNSMDAARAEKLSERGIVDTSCIGSLLNDEETVAALIEPGCTTLTPALRPPKRGELAVKKKKKNKKEPQAKVLIQPVTSTPFVGKNSGEGSVDATPVTGRLPRPTMDPLGITPVASETPRPAIVVTTEERPKKSRRELLKSRKSQITGPTPDKTFVYKVNHGCLDDVKAQIEPDYLTIFSLELLLATRGDLLPDPLLDSILAAFYYISNDVEPSSDLVSGKQTVLGVILVSKDPSKEWELRRNFFKQEIEVTSVLSEMELIDAVVELVKMWDPDILLGFEVQQLSWGYLIDRAEALGSLLPPKLSRIPAEEKASHAKEDLDPYGSSHTSEIHLCGRITLNVWRLFRHEIALTSYTFENLYYHVLHERVHLVSHRTLFERWTDRNKVFVVKFLTKRVEGNLALLEKMDLIGRTCELARLFGIQFYEVLSRGSQFRVESMMLRLAKPANYVPVSPSVDQRAQMRAPECIPLILEPESKLYSDPVVVLDFQSLYPSVIIAYNYCFSTCLGRADLTGQVHPFKFGCTTLRVPAETIAKLGSKMTISPCGVAFVTAEVRRGILPKMLDQILTTRIMVKQSMKLHKGDQALQRVLDARQLGLKLIANVTYGYTSANFSGRMACIEIADSVVSKGRETLEKAIKMVHAVPEWDARVVYGDTDSMFILLPGRDRENAFRIGQEIAAAVTKANPKPVKLKFEKVYYPCILQTKKRYVGYKYESPDQAEPEYEAKGIETVRRDGVPAVCKILEKTLRLLFESKDISVVKRYVEKQMSKVLLGRINVADLTFAKEFRGVEGYKPGACVPALELTKKRTKVDKRAVPRVGERFPYVVVYGPPGVPLIQLVREPSEVLKDPALRLNAHYYITKVIVPPLARCLNMMQGVNVMSWYSNIPKVYKAWCQGAPEGASGPGASTITQFFATTSCPACEAPTSSLGGEVTLCSKCFDDPQISALILLNKTKTAVKRMHDLNQICKSCVGLVVDDVKCESLDCPLLHFREMWKKDQAKVKSLDSVLDAFSAVW